MIPKQHRRIGTRICSRVLWASLVAGLLASCNDERLQKALERQDELEHQVDQQQSQLTEMTKRVTALEQSLAALRLLSSRSSVPVQLDCPSEWERVSNPPEPTLLVCRTTTPTADGFWPNCNVTSGPAEPGQSARDYVHGALEGAPELHGAHHIGEHDRTLAGAPGYEAEYEHSLGGRATRVLVAVVVKDQRAFAVTCSVAPDLFATYQPAFDRIIGSFRFGG